MFKGKKYVIFDLDGTLIDSMGLWPEFYKDFLLKLNSNIIVDDYKDDYKLAFSQYQYDNMYIGAINYIKNKYNLTMDIEDLYKLFLEIRKKDVEKSIFLKDHVIDFLNLLKKKKFTMFLATISDKPLIHNYIEKSNVKDLFKFFPLKYILTADDVVNKKPHPEIYLKALKLLKARPEECIVIEDSLSGVIAAKEAGIEVINIYDKYSDYERDEINKQADYIVKDYKELIYILNKETRD
jgi:beta-phosphoglucomutase-like phosphatase (HAD superfamily)